MVTTHGCSQFEHHFLVEKQDLFGSIQWSSYYTDFIHQKIERSSKLMKFHQFFNLVLAFWLEGCRGIRPSTRLIASTTGHRWGNQLGSCLADVVWITKLLKPKSKKRWNHKLRTIYQKKHRQISNTYLHHLPQHKKPLHDPHPGACVSVVAPTFAPQPPQRIVVCRSSSVARCPAAAATAPTPRPLGSVVPGISGRPVVLRRWAHFIHPRAA